MRNIFLHILFVFLITTTSAQSRVVVKGTIKDNVTQIPIHNAGVYEQGREHYKTPSNEDGIFHIAIKPKSKTTLVFRHLGYERHYLVLTEKALANAKNDTLMIDVVLKQITKELDVFDVFSTKPDTVFGSEVYSVADFEFLDKRLIILGYEKQLSKGAYVMATGERGGVLSKQLVPDDVNRLFRSFRGEVFVVGKSVYYQVILRGDVVSLLPVEPLIFEGFHAIVNDTIEDNFYYSDYSDFYPAFTYYVSERNDTSRVVLREVEDKFMMELYRSEYKYVDTKTKLWAAKQEAKTGIDKEIWVGVTSFTQSLYYKTLYAPLFVSNDTALLFDHHSDYLFRYNKNNRVIDSIPISYHKTKGSNQWEKPLLKDPVSQKVYAVFMKGAYFYLKEIEPTTGEVKQVIKLYFRFVDKIRIHNGKAYYVYRPFESAQRKFLYSERIE
ncbi:MAG: carboxypeptidase-like regulatory domain-containing protein [Flavobacteriales bacterium]